MSRHAWTAAALPLLALAAGCAPTEPPPIGPRPDYPRVAGGEMYPDRTIVENAMNARELTRLVAAIQRAGLADRLMEAGPYTFFAPTDAAFEQLPADALADLMRTENRARLERLLLSHVIPGEKRAADIAADITAGGGTASYATLAGGALRATMRGAHVELTDASGGRALISRAEAPQSNGMLHIVDAVLTVGE